ncbi:hypothetical protein B0H67DRAFT_350674 [Lasiosphaeris hirsuta]|uniref:Kelch repeat-containing protein n=1 Tax=Lasiosphaeris hirsuta TaxID=260670 RepID=A0AA39ZVS2_9PEZI|nr:hypothetical protein B0H67DRAFT_350674 [Lasiosphaeris hirsuta]
MAHSSRLSQGATWRLSSLSLLCSWVAFAAGQGFDPVKDFCRRWGQQSAVVDDRLYVDGGFVNYKPLTESSLNYTNPFFLYSDLGTEVEGMPPLHANLSKNATIPAVNGGMLWEDSVNKRLYLYGGETYQTPPTSFVLYSYDILYNNWVSFGPPSGSATVIPTSYGAGVSISWRGEAYYYGGWMSNTSVPGWVGPPQASSRMIKYTMDGNTFSNLTGPDNVARADGEMVYIPIGDAGMLVYFGGSQDLYGNGTLTAQPLDTIFLFDIANTKWYTQKTTGRTPENRRRFCGGAAWAQDQSSYNIYIFGGAGFPPDTTGFDDVYILTIPSFQWIRGPYPPGSNITGAYPKSGMSCNVVNNAQMLIVGGSYSNDTTFSCDADVVWGEHNMDLGEQNPEDAIWAKYKPSLTTYIVPTDILTAIGGQNTGGAKTKTPISGFAHIDLSILMTRQALISTRAATRDVSIATAGSSPSGGGGGSSPLSAGAIAGIAIGSAVGLILALLGCFWCIRRRQKHYEGPRNGSTAAPPPGWGGPPVSPTFSQVTYVPPSPAPPPVPAHPPAELASDDTPTGLYYPATAPLAGHSPSSTTKYETPTWQQHPVAEMRLPVTAAGPPPTGRNRRTSSSDHSIHDGRGGAPLPGHPFYSPPPPSMSMYPQYTGPQDARSNASSHSAHSPRQQSPTGQQSPGGYGWGQLDRSQSQHGGRF